MDLEKIICVFCGTPWTKEMIKIYNGNSDCDSGCGVYRVVVECSKCGKIVYIKAEYGGVDSKLEKEKVLDDINKGKGIEYLNEYLINIKINKEYKQSSNNIFGLDDFEEFRE
jgi:hypothetical protein